MHSQAGDRPFAHLRDRASRLSLRARAGILLLAFVVVPVTLLGAAVSLVDYRAAHRTIDATLAAHATSRGRELDAYVAMHRHALSLVARDWRMNAWYGERELIERLQQLREEYPGFLTLLMTDAGGEIIAAEPRASREGVGDFWRGTSVADRAYFDQPRLTQRAFTGSLLRGRGFGADWIFPVAVPVVRNGRFAGVVEGSLPAFRPAIADGDAASGTPALVISDAAGTVVSASPGLGLATGDRLPADGWLAPVLRSGHEGLVAATADAGGAWLGRHETTANGWHVAVLVPAATLTHSLWLAALIGLALVASAIVAALMLLPWATRLLTEQIARLAARIHSFSPENPRDCLAAEYVPTELVPIHSSFNAMAGKLHQAFEQQRQALATERGLRGELESGRRAIAESARLLRLVIECVPEAVLAIDATGMPLLSNAAAQALPTANGDDTCLYAADGSTPHEPPLHWLQRALAAASGSDGHEIVLRSAGRGDRHIVCVARPLRDDAGALRGAVGVFRDVTAERAAQRQLMVADRMASIGMLAAGVGHEINNPLAALVTNLELALTALDAGDGMTVRELLRDADDAATRIRAIVRDLKTFARHDADAVGACDLQQVLESSLRLGMNEIRHRARVVRDYGPPLRVAGSESRLGQVFLNLLVNAAQAMPDGEAGRNTITLRTRRGDDGAAIAEIVDTGAGMSPETLRNLFTPFFTTKPAGVGTGLGLAICQRIIAEAGGRIAVESTPGRGTCFQVILPPAAPERDAAVATVAASAAAADALATDEPKDAGAAPHHPSAHEATAASIRSGLAADAPPRGRILVVDDERLVAAAIRRVLMREHEVVECTRGADALARMRAGEQFDLILCDLMMPEMTGMELHAQASRAAPRLAERMVFLTGGAFTPAARDFLAQPGRERVEKPFEADKLRALVNAHVREIAAHC